jgi:hypothetical protein
LLNRISGMNILLPEQQNQQTQQDYVNHPGKN